MPASTHRVEPLTEPPDAVVAVPGSKSITNRALVCAALAGGASTLRGIGARRTTPRPCSTPSPVSARTCGSTRRTATAPGRWGRPAPCGPVRSSSTPAWPARRRASSPRWPRSVRAGTASTAASPSARARWRRCTTRSSRSAPASSRSRPGATSRSIVTAGGLRGGAVALPGDVSSQFVTALMLVAPATGRGIQVELTSPLVVPPLPGHHAGRDGCLRGRRRGGGASARSPSAPAATAGPTTRSSPTRPRPRTCGRRPPSPAAGCVVPGFGPTPLQGDAAFVDLLGRMGAGSSGPPSSIAVGRPRRCEGIDVDMADWSDTAPTLAAVACFADSPTRIRGVGLHPPKETDRIGSLVAELRRCGVDATEEADGLDDPPRPRRRPRRPASAPTTTTAWP